MQHVIFVPKSVNASEHGTVLSTGAIVDGIEGTVLIPHKGHHRVGCCGNVEMTTARGWECPTCGTGHTMVSPGLWARADLV